MRRRTLGVLGAAWLTLPPAVLILLQVVTGKPGLVPRYWAFVLPAVAVGLGLAVGAIPRARAGWAVAGAAALVGVSLVPQLAIRGSDSHDGTRYEALAEVVALPGLSPMPVLIRSAYYRTLMANAPRSPTLAGPPRRRPGRHDRWTRSTLTR